MSICMGASSTLSKLSAILRNPFPTKTCPTNTVTVAVCAGQLFVGSGFRRMAESFDRVLDAPIQMDIGIPRYEKDPWEDHPMLIR